VEPHGPGTPVVRGDTVLDRIACVLLNPQPLPPKVAAARLTRAVINETVREVQIAEAAGESGTAQYRRVGSAWMDWIDHSSSGRPPDSVPLVSVVMKLCSG